MVVRGDGGVVSGEGAVRQNNKETQRETDRQKREPEKLRALQKRCIPDILPLVAHKAVFILRCSLRKRKKKEVKSATPNRILQQLSSGDSPPGLGQPPEERKDEDSHVETPLVQSIPVINPCLPSRLISSPAKRATGPSETKCS